MEPFQILPVLVVGGVGRPDQLARERRVQLGDDAFIQLWLCGDGAHGILGPILRRPVETPGRPPRERPRR